MRSVTPSAPLQKLRSASKEVFLLSPREEKLRVTLQRKCATPELHGYHHRYNAAIRAETGRLAVEACCIDNFSFAPWMKNTASGYPDLNLCVASLWIVGAICAVEGTGVKMALHIAATLYIPFVGLPMEQ